jgi:hypothetical protein
VSEIADYDNSLSQDAAFSSLVLANPKYEDCLIIDPIADLAKPKSSQR